MVSVTGLWVGLDNAIWSEYSTDRNKAWKTWRPHKSGARVVGRFCCAGFITL